MNNNREKDLYVLFNDTHKVTTRDLNEINRKKQEEFNDKMFGSDLANNSKGYVSEVDKMKERQKNMNAMFHNMNRNKF